MYKFWGKVRKHNQRGKTLGFPTANINLAKNIPAGISNSTKRRIIVPEGVYISKTKISGTEYKQSLKKLRFFKSITFIGTAKTFGETYFHAETYILDFKQNIYDKWITVELLKKIRGNKKFDSAEKLVDQMKQDEKIARQFFAS